MENDKRDVRAVSRLFHWLGHVVFNMDCGIRSDDNYRHMFCKKCGREVR